MAGTFDCMDCIYALLDDRVAGGDVAETAGVILCDHCFVRLSMDFKDALKRGDEVTAQRIVERGEDVFRCNQSFMEEAHYVNTLKRSQK